MTRKKIITAIIAVVASVAGVQTAVFVAAWKIVERVREVQDCGCASTMISPFHGAAIFGLVGLTVVGLLVGMLYAARTLLRTRRFIRKLTPSSCLRRDIPLFKGGPCEAFTFGFCKPRIAVCEHCVHTLPETELAAMLSHEQYHVLRKDPLWFFVLDTVRHILFFVPLLRSLTAAYRAVSELAADEGVRDREALGGALLRLAERKGAALYALAISRFASILGVRIERLVNPSFQLRLRFSGLQIMLTLLILAGSLGAVFSGSAPAQETLRCARRQAACVSPTFDAVPRAYYTNFYSSSF